MQNFPPLSLYQFFWNWNKCFNSKKPAVLQAERQAVIGLLFQAIGWTNVYFGHLSGESFIPSLASLGLHLTTESFPSSLICNYPHLDPVYGEETRTVARNIHLLFMLQMLMGKKKQLTFINQMCQKGPRKIYSCRYIFPFGDSQSKQTEREKQMTNNNNNKTPVH